MSGQEDYDITSVSLNPEFTSIQMAEDIVWVPDAITLELHSEAESEESGPVHHSYTCLEHVFLLFDQIERSEPGTVIWGSSGIQVSFILGGEVHLTHKGIVLSGSRKDVREAVEHLIEAIFLELLRRGVDTRRVTRELLEGRHNPWTANPLTVHDRLMG